MIKNLTKLRWIVWTSLIAAILLTGCKSDPNEDFIQGIWYYNSEHLANIPAESHQSDNWLFERRTFQNASCCFTKTNMRGSYRILESDENTIELELYEIVGDQGGTAIPDDTTIVLTIIIDQENDTIKINRAEPYTRITP
jgi:hypothetical protein